MVEKRRCALKPLSACRLLFRKHENKAGQGRRQSAKTSPWTPASRERRRSTSPATPTVMSQGRRQSARCGHPLQQREGDGWQDNERARSLASSLEPRDGQLRGVPSLGRPMQDRRRRLQRYGGGAVPVLNYMTTQPRLPWHERRASPRRITELQQHGPPAHPPSHTRRVVAEALRPYARQERFPCPSPSCRPRRQDPNGRASTAPHITAKQAAEVMKHTLKVGRRRRRQRGPGKPPGTRDHDPIEPVEDEAPPQWTAEEIADRDYVDCMVMEDEDAREQEAMMQDYQDAVAPQTAADIAEADRDNAARTARQQQAEAESAARRARQLQDKDEAREILEAVAQWEAEHGPMWGEVHCATQIDDDFHSLMQAISQLHTQLAQLQQALDQQSVITQATRAQVLHHRRRWRYEGTSLPDPAQTTDALLEVYRSKIQPHKVKHTWNDLERHNLPPGPGAPTTPEMVEDSQNGTDMVHQRRLEALVCAAAQARREEEQAMAQSMERTTNASHHHELKNKPHMVGQHRQRHLHTKDYASPSAHHNNRSSN